MTDPTSATTRHTLERMYAAARAGDTAGLSALMHPALRVEEPPFLPYGGTYTGLDEFAGVFGRAPDHRMTARCRDRLRASRPDG